MPNRIRHHRHLSPTLRIAIIVRTKDRPHLLTRSLHSLAEQKRLPDEVIVINDGGVAVDTVIAAFNHLPIQSIHHTTSQGRAKAGNSGVHAVRSDVIGFLDDDDRWLPDHLQRLEKAMLLFDAKVAYSGCRLLQRDIAGEKLILQEQAIGEFNEAYDAARFYYENYIPLINLLIDRSFWLAIGGFDESFDVFEDWDVLLRLSQKTTFYHVNRITAEYAVWGENQVTRQADRQRWIDAYRQFLAKHVLSLPTEKALEHLAHYWRLSQERRGIVRETIEEKRDLQLKLMQALQDTEQAQHHLAQYQTHHTQLQQQCDRWSEKYEQLQADWTRKYEGLQTDWDRKYEKLATEHAQSQATWSKKYEQLQTDWQKKYDTAQSDWQRKYDQLQASYAQLQLDWTKKYERLATERDQNYQQLQTEWQDKHAQLQAAYDQQEAHFKQQQADMLREIDKNITLYQQARTAVEQEKNYSRTVKDSLEEMHRQLALGLTQQAIEKSLTTQPPIYPGKITVDDLRAQHECFVTWYQTQQQHTQVAHQAWQSTLQASNQSLREQLDIFTQKALKSRWLHYGGYVKLLDKINSVADTLDRHIAQSGSISQPFDRQDENLPPPRPVSGLRPSLITFAGSSEQPHIMEYVAQRGHLALHLDSKAACVFTTYCPSDGFFRFDLAFATYLRVNTCYLRVIIRLLDDPTPLRVIQYNALSLLDNLFHPVTFEPFPASAGKTYHIEIDSPDANDEQAVAVWCYATQPPAEPICEETPVLPNTLPHWLQQNLLAVPLSQYFSTTLPVKHLFMLSGVTHLLHLHGFLNALGQALAEIAESGAVIVCGVQDAEVIDYCQQHALPMREDNDIPVLLSEARNWAAEKLDPAGYVWLCDAQAIPTPASLYWAKQAAVEEDTALLVPLQQYPDGRISGAYALIDQYGNLQNFPLGMQASHPYHGYRRTIEAASSTLVALKHRYLATIDVVALCIYETAIYQITDLIWQFKAAACNAVYESAFCYQEEGAPTTIAPRDYATDQPLFFKRWRQPLAAQARLLLNQHSLLNPEQQPTILIIDATLPAYDEDSGSLRLITLIKLMIALGYRVTFFPDNLDSHFKYRHALEALGAEVFHSPHNIVDALSFRTFTFAFICRVDIGHRYIPFLRLVSPSTQIFYDTVDIHYIREYRQAEIENNPELTARAQMTRRKELANCLLADKTLTVTEDDAKHLQQELPQLDFSVIPNVHVLQPLADTSFEQRTGLVFIGNYNHQPNEDAVYFFIDTVLPTIRRTLPQVKLYLIGSHMKERMKQLQGEHVEVIGWVDEVAPAFAERRVFVSCLRYGAGMKGKLGQALSLGLPVVTTSIGAEGMGLIDGETALIADDPDRFATAVCRLYQEAALWEKLARQGRDYIERRYGEAAVRQKLQDLLTSAL